MHSDLEENKNLTEICSQPSVNEATFITWGNSWGRKKGGMQHLVDFKKNASLLRVCLFFSTTVLMIHLHMENIS